MGNLFELADAPKTNDPAELRELYQAVQAQRASDVERLRSAIRDREYLKTTIAELDAKLAELKSKVSFMEAAQSNAIVLRLGRSDSASKGGLLAKIAAAVLLRFARRFARTERFVEAEALYTSVAVFKPRPFLIKQVGNMLYRQGSYKAAIDVLKEVQEHYQSDGEVTFLINASEAAMPK